LKAPVKSKIASKPVQQSEITEALTESKKIGFASAMAILVDEVTAIKITTNAAMTVVFKNIDDSVSPLMSFLENKKYKKVHINDKKIFTVRDIIPSL